MRINPNYTILIPCRNGSKGLKRKNIFPVNGMPLYMHTLNYAYKLNFNIIITTDIAEILSSDFDKNVLIDKRPDLLCQDSTSMDDVISYVIDKYKITNNIILLQPTSPNRELNTIYSCIDLYEKVNPSLLMTVNESDSSILKSGFISNNRFVNISNNKFTFQNRQSLPNVYKPNGSVYIINVIDFVKNNTFSSENICAYIDDSNVCDIDNINDILNLQKGFYNENKK